MGRDEQIQRDVRFASELFRSFYFTLFFSPLPHLQPPKKFTELEISNFTDGEVKRLGGMEGGVAYRIKNEY